MTDTRNAVQMLAYWAQRRPNARWLSQPGKGRWQRWTWSEVHEQVARMATALQSLGLRPGGRVAISGLNSAHWFMADLAIAMAGGVSVGLYPRQNPDQVRYILEHSDAEFLFVGPMPEPKVFMSGVPKTLRTIRLPYPAAPESTHEWDDLVAQHEPLRHYEAPSPDTLATLVYTSGTTGQPKGVMITQRNVIFSTAGALKAMPAVGTERLFSYLPLAHMFERGAVELTSLYLGAEVWFLESQEKLAEQLQQTSPTRFYAVPLVYTRMQTAVLKKVPQKKLDRLLRIPILAGVIRRRILKNLGLSRARFVVAGAAPMPDSLTQWFQKLGITIFQGYGMTENAIYATVNLPDANRLGSVGRELPDAGLKIASDGEILFRSDAVMAGYFKDEEKTRETFTTDGYLRTGDQGRIDQDGYLFITGRLKDQFKTEKGKYVAPAPIESDLSRNSDIEQLCLVGSGLKQPIMLVTLSATAHSKPLAQLQAELTADRDAINAHLEPHEKIAKIVVVKDAWTVDNGMATPTMKVKRREVEAHYAELVQRESATRNAVAWEK